MRIRALLPQLIPPFNGLSLLVVWSIEEYLLILKLNKEFILCIFIPLFMFVAIGEKKY